MTATGLEVFDDALHKTNTWLKEIAQELSVDRHGAYQGPPRRADAHLALDRTNLDNRLSEDR
jgi:hypothetical protein